MISIVFREKSRAVAPRPDSDEFPENWLQNLLPIVSRLSPTRVFLQLNPDSPGAWWQPYLWPRHLTPHGSGLFYFPNKILKFNPGYHSLTIVYCAQQMTLNSPESPLTRRVNTDWFKNYDKDCQIALSWFGHKQWSSDNPGHGDGDWQPNWPWRGNGRL